MKKKNKKRKDERDKNEIISSCSHSWHSSTHICIFLWLNCNYFVLDAEKIQFPAEVLDASGHVAPGFIWGNNYWLGSAKACSFVNQRAPVILSHELPKNHFKNLTYIESPFPVEYKLVWAKHRSQWQIDINTFEKVSEIPLSIQFNSINAHILNRCSSSET